MYSFPIGVILESFRTDRSTAIKKAAAIGANGIQMYATQGENSPENLSASDRKALLKEVKDAGLVFSALCGDLGKGYCTACFDGDYPTEVPTETHKSKFECKISERQKEKK